MDSPGPDSCKIRFFPGVFAYPILHSALARLHCALGRLHCALARLHCALARLHCALARLHCALAKLDCGQEFKKSAQQKLKKIRLTKLSKKRSEKLSTNCQFFLAVYVFSRRGQQKTCRVCIFPREPFYVRERSVF